MRALIKILNAISIVSMLLTGIGVIAYYVIEFISSFCISTINLVEIGNVFWKIIFICFGSAVCSFVLAYFINKKQWSSKNIKNPKQITRGLSMIYLYKGFFQPTFILISVALLPINIGLWILSFSPFSIEILITSIVFSFFYIISILGIKKLSSSKKTTYIRKEAIS